MEKTYNLQNRSLIASIYKTYREELKIYLFGYTRDMMAAEDMLQDLFLKLMYVDVITEETAKGLVFVMARRMIIDDARHCAFVRERERNYALTVSSMDTDSVVRRVEHDEIRQLEQIKINRMAPKRARVYEMYRHEELTAQEIADQLNLSRRTVETHIYLSTMEMRNYLRKVVGE